MLYFNTWSGSRLSNARVGLDAPQQMQRRRSQRPQMRRGKTTRCDTSFLTFSFSSTHRLCTCAALPTRHPLQRGRHQALHEEPVPVPAQHARLLFLQRDLLPGISLRLLREQPPRPGDILRGRVFLRCFQVRSVVCSLPASIATDVESCASAATGRRGAGRS